MRLVVLAFLLVLILGCAQHNPTVINKTGQNVQPPVNSSALNTSPSNQTNTIVVPPSNQTNTTVPPLNTTNTTNQSTNTTMNISANPQGLVFGDGKYSIVLDDVSLTGNVPCGIFSIRETNDSAILDRMVICASESGIWVSPEGHRFRIRADKVAAGYTNQAMWAQVEIFG